MRSSTQPDMPCRKAVSMRGYVSTSARKKPPSRRNSGSRIVPIVRRPLISWRSAASAGPPPPRRPQQDGGEPQEFGIEDRPDSQAATDLVAKRSGHALDFA